MVQLEQGSVRRPSSGCLSALTDGFLGPLPILPLLGILLCVACASIHRKLGVGPIFSPAHLRPGPDVLLLFSDAYFQSQEHHPRVSAGASRRARIVRGRPGASMNNG